MRGRIRAESEEGRGSTFHFTAWIVRQAQAPPVRIEPGAERLRDLPILVVDDNRTILRVVADILKRWEARPTAVESGPEALDALRRAAGRGTPFALVLLDGMMPEMDGFELADQIRADPSLVGTIIMMLTSNTLAGDIGRCKQLGIAAHLTKPIPQCELWDTLRTVLGGAPAGQTPPTPPPTGSPPRTHGEAARPLKILLAEDHAFNQKVASVMLRKQGHAVVVVGDGKSALAALEHDAFDIVLMDLQMPEMDGLQATAAIRARERHDGGHIPIIAMTAHAMKEDRKRCLDAGMDGYIPKPIRSEALSQAIKDCTTEAGSVRSAVPGASHARPNVGHAAAPARVGGDRAFLAEMTAKFLVNCPRLMEGIRAAIAHGDAPRVRAESYALRNLVGNFVVPSAVEATRAMEAIGHAGDRDGAEAAYATLEREILRLGPELGRLLS